MILSHHREILKSYFSEFSFFGWDFLGIFMLSFLLSNTGLLRDGTVFRQLFLYLVAKFIYLDLTTRIVS